MFSFTDEADINDQVFGREANVFLPKSVAL